MIETFATSQIGVPVLSLMILLPVIVSVALYFVSPIAQLRRIAIGAILVELVLGLIALLAFDSNGADVQLAESVGWMPVLGSSLHLGVDGISVLFLPLSALVILLAMLSGGVVPKGSPRGYWVNLLLLQASVVGVYTAQDLVLFFLFWEAMLIPSYFLILLWGNGSSSKQVASNYVLYMLIGSVPLLIGIAALGASTGTFDLVALSGMDIPGELQTLVFVLFFIAFAVKAPLPPFHTWLPAVAMGGPAGIAIFLVGLKLGTYGMIKILLPLVPDAVVAWQPFLIWYGILAMLYGGFVALAQNNLRRMLAYASVSHVGMVVAGIFALNATALQGSVMAMVNMTIASTVMMLLAGTIFRRLGTTDLNGLGGVARHAPVMAVAFFLAALASIGMPGTSGFQGEFAILAGVFEAGRLAGAVALLGVILGAGYVLWFYERAFFGPVASKNVSAMQDLGKNERGGVMAAIALILLLGLAPSIAIRTTSGAAETLVQTLSQQNATQVATVATSVIK